MLANRLFLPIILVIMSAALVPFGLGDSGTLVGDTSVPSNEVASSASETDDRDSSSATITIIMRTPPCLTSSLGRGNTFGLPPVLVPLMMRQILRVSQRS